MTFGVAMASAAAATALFSAGQSVIHATVGSFAEYETGLANVQKTTGLSKAAIAELSVEFDKLAATLPVSTKTMLDIAGAAGALGVGTKEGILAVTDAVAKLGVTTNLTGEEGAQKMVRLMNVFGEAPTSIGRVANALVALDNTNAATAREILNIGTEVGLATQQFHIGSEAALAFGATMANMGVRAELGGTAVGRTMLSIQRSLTGELPKGLKVLEQLFGENQAAMKQWFSADPSAFFVALLKHLEEARLGGSKLFSVLHDLGLDQQQTNKSIGALIGHWSDLEKSMATVHDQARLQTAQNKELAIFLETVAGKAQILHNNWTQLMKDFGASGASTAKDAMDALSKAIQSVDTWWKGLNTTTQQSIMHYGMVATAVLGVTVAVTALVAVFGLLMTVTGGWLALGIAAMIGVITGAALDMNGAFQTSISLTQDQADKMKLLETGGYSAASALGEMTRAEAELIALKLAEELRVQSETIETLKNKINSVTGQSGWGGYISKMLDAAGIATGVGQQVGETLAGLTEKHLKGEIALGEYLSLLAGIAQQNPGIASQVREFAALVAKLDETTGAAARTAAAMDQVRRAASNLPEVRTPSRRRDSDVAYETGPAAVLSANDALTARTVTPSPAKTAKGSKGKGDQIADFYADFDVKMENADKLTQAYTLGEDAVRKYTDETRRASEVNAIEKRGIDLKIPSIKEMTEEYRKQMEARDNAKMQMDIDKAVIGINLEMSSLEQETQALNAGQKAWDEYKRHSQLESQSDKMYERLTQLGMEADAARKVADEYFRVAEAHAAAGDAAEKNKKSQQEMKSLMTDIGNSVESAAESLVYENKKIGDIAKTLEDSIAKAVLKALIFKPIENALTGLFDGGMTSGSSSSSSESAGGGQAAGILGSVMGLATKAFGLFGGATADNFNPSSYGGAAGQTILGDYNNQWNAADQAIAMSYNDVTGTYGGNTSDSTSGLIDKSVVPANSNLSGNTKITISKFHDGLGGDEFAAILQRGERVLNTGQQAAVLAGVQDGNQQGGDVNHFTFNLSNNPTDTDGFKRSIPQTMAKAANALGRVKRRSN
jgi:TP901 family phage tail tape measure protein